MLFQHEILNHKYKGVIVPICRVRTISALVNADGTCTLQTEYFAVEDEIEYFQTTKTDSFRINLDQALRPQILAYFGAIFAPKNEEQS